MQKELEEAKEAQILAEIEARVVHDRCIFGELKGAFIQGPDIVQKRIDQTTSTARAMFSGTETRQAMWDTTWRKPCSCCRT